MQNETTLCILTYLIIINFENLCTKQCQCVGENVILNVPKHTLSPLWCVCRGSWGPPLREHLLLIQQRDNLLKSVWASSNHTLRAHDWQMWAANQSQRTMQTGCERHLSISIPRDKDHRLNIDQCNWVVEAFSQLSSILNGKNLLWNGLRWCRDVK